ncbi:MAG: hypothetical protein ACYCO9_16285 [Streptosporangiaceae bacterium]
MIAAAGLTAAALLAASWLTVRLFRHAGQHAAPRDRVFPDMETLPATLPPLPAPPIISAPRVCGSARIWAKAAPTRPVPAWVQEILDAPYRGGALLVGVPE